MVRLPLSRFLVSLGLAGLAACAADSVMLPSDGAPARITILGGNDQLGTAGQVLGESLIVRVSDRGDRPVVNQAVSFVVTSGGQVTPATVVTDAEGKAAFSWTLGTTAGSQVLQVGVDGSGGLTPMTSFSAMAEAGPVRGLQKVRGDNQTAQISHPLADSLVVLLVDEFGNPVGGKEVVWQASSGALSRNRVATGPDGRAAVVWTLGSAVGTQHASAQFGSVNNSPSDFTATATQGPPPRLVMLTQPSTTAETDAAFARQPAVRLVDDLGNALQRSGVLVTAAIASGGGTLLGTTTRATDGAGVAQFTDLRISGTAGSRTLIFAAVGHIPTTSDPIAITVTHGPPPPPPPPPGGGTSTVSAPASVQAGSSAAVTVTVKDASGNPLSGITVRISVTGSSNSITQPIATTNSSGVATATFSSTKAESKTVTATANGQRINQSASVTVDPGPPSATTTSAHVPGGKVLKFTVITITTEDGFGNPLRQGGYAGALSVSVSGANGSTPPVQDQGNGTYTATYFPLFKGNDTIDIRLNGVPIKGSPFPAHIRFLR
jgi:adhesin/invasin